MERINQGNSSIEKLSFEGSLSEEKERIEPLNLQPLVKLEEVILYNRITSLENIHTSSLDKSWSTSLQLSQNRQS